MTTEPDAAATPLEGGAVLYRLEGSLAQLTLNRPKVLNAINGAVHRGILEGLARAAGDDAVRAVVIRGNGRAFSAGGDLKAVAAGEDVGHPVVLGQAIWNLAKPVIAAVHGYCLGQACEVAAVCDLTVAARSTTFGEVEINHGWGPPLPITPFVLGLKRAKEVLLLGEMFDAELAVAIGLVNRVVDDAGLDAEVARIADRIAGLKPDAVAANKRLVNSRYEQAGFVPGSS
ncbi:MAG TPA: enoyl-CoA hydratase/isomerase family protein [Trebonia sp.]|nr:enoyl-CoA hydratase/isomerase family protein [Trebonia sp.]